MQIIGTELQLSEGKGTGIPTIQDELRRNDSGPAVIETNEERSCFLIEIHYREGERTADTARLGWWAMSLRRKNVGIRYIV